VRDYHSFPTKDAIAHPFEAPISFNDQCTTSNLALYLSSAALFTIITCSQTDRPFKHRSDQVSEVAFATRDDPRRPAKRCRALIALSLTETSLHYHADKTDHEVIVEQIHGHESSWN
jgi:hypothetical protein